MGNLDYKLDSLSNTFDIGNLDYKLDNLSHIHDTDNLDYIWAQSLAHLGMGTQTQLQFMAHPG